MKSLIELSLRMETNVILQRILALINPTFPGSAGHNSQQCYSEHHTGPNLLSPSPVEPDDLRNGHRYYNNIKGNIDRCMGPSLDINIVATALVFSIPFSPGVADGPALN